MRRTLRSQYLAVPQAPATARREVQPWLTAHGWPEEDIDDLVLALNEAVTNSAEHAYPSTGLNGRIELTITLRSGDDGTTRAVVTVTDHGRWRIPASSPGYRGRGLQMMRALTESVELRAGSLGTRVTMVSRPVCVGADVAGRPTDMANEMANEMGVLS
ncbi:MAG TPA: ATP-binding protein [Pseudonocardia sp.]|nr:ATP-binding protein [Pseudonocardia sp.]